MQLTIHISYEEMIRSDWAARQGVDNGCPDHLLDNLRRTAEGLQIIRNFLGVPLTINSGYRCPAVNAAIGGAPTSQHLEAKAADFVAPLYGTPEAIARALEPKMAEFGIDQLIFEFGRWVHVSFSDAPRNRALSIWTGSGGYKDGIVTA